MNKENALIHTRMGLKALNSAFEKAEKDLIMIVKEMGGIIRTPVSDDKPTLYANVFNCIDNTALDSEAIYAIAYVDYGEGGEGLMILTETEMENYEFDNDFEFGDDETADKAAYEDMTKDITYFRDLNDGYTDYRGTIYSILAGLESYLA